MIEIRLRKYRLFLTESEITSLLEHDPELWERAIRRGKGVLRYRKDKYRQAEFRRKINSF